jgi:UDP-N-acetylmuramoylalanine--D-glutamate ligase
MVERIAILGMGLSGQAAARLVHFQGGDSVGFDINPELGSPVFDASSVSTFDCFIISPGFPETHPWRIIAEKSGKPCLSEIGYAARFWKGRIVGITGTNGKTSLTGLLVSALRQSSVSAFAAGNIGQPFADLVISKKNQADAVVVCELSSFQAELPQGLELDALLWTNFGVDHLDRYPSLESYFSAKWQLTDCLKPKAEFLYGREVRMAMQQFSKIDLGTAINSENVSVESLDPNVPFVREPQRSNFALAHAFLESWGYLTKGLIEAANNYKLPPHRLQLIDHQEGVNFWNDSKATNFHAVKAALEAMPTGPVIWVGGGRAKGEDLNVLAELLENRVTAACVYGETGAILANNLKLRGLMVEDAHSLEDAINKAKRLAFANSPAQVLFSPGFASFDAFKSYIDRGKFFISVVLGLKASTAEE